MPETKIDGDLDPSAPRVGSRLKERLKQRLGPNWQLRAHRLGRFRWITKYRLVRELEPKVGLRRRVSFIFLDPEIESFSFELEDENEAMAELGAALGYPQGELLGYAAETRSDPELNDRLVRHTRWRIDVKRRPPLGHRLAWYVIVRALKPELIVETGIYLGLGSLVLLRALERNRQEGHPGTLMSFDISPSAGTMVRGDVREGWQRFVGSTGDLLGPALEGRRVGMLIQDTPHTQENQRVEYGAALANADDRLLLLDASGGSAGGLEELCAKRGGSYHNVVLRSHQHVFPGANITFGLFDRRDPEG